MSEKYPANQKPEVIIEEPLVDEIVYAINHLLSSHAQEFDWSEKKFISKVQQYLDVNSLQASPSEIMACYEMMQSSPL